MEPATAIRPVPVLRIEASAGWRALRLAEIWAYRELLFFLVWRDIKVRYQHTVLGAGWAIVQPLFTMVVFTVFFGRLARMPSDGVPYPVFSYAALVPWTQFATGLAQSANSLVGGAHLVRKVYFPRVLLPLGEVTASLIDLLPALAVLVALMLFYGIAPSARCLALPVFLLVSVTTCLGAGLWLAALNVEYRDVRYLLPFMVQFWLFATPVAYPSSLLSPAWRVVYGVNPMASVVDGFRWSLLGAPPPPLAMFAVSAVTATALLISGLFYFRRVERTFADTL
ncbi:MAG: phosphate ABC transporter permease [Acidobacteria bacterium]|nr:MAG: phosphate ABC transporter permease [Acidobacteriota bacterium]